MNLSKACLVVPYIRVIHRTQKIPKASRFKSNQQLLLLFQGEMLEAKEALSQDAHGRPACTQHHRERPSIAGIYLTTINEYPIGC